MKTGMNYELDLQMIRPDGTTRWIAARGEAERDITGRITRLRGTGQDITERKRAEHKIQEQANLLGLASDAILVRIIVATGTGSPPGANSVHKLGVQAYIKKPFDLAHLLGTLQRVLHQEKAR